MYIERSWAYYVNHKKLLRGFIHSMQYFTSCYLRNQEVEIKFHSSPASGVYHGISYKHIIWYYRNIEFVLLTRPLSRRNPLFLSMLLVVETVSCFLRRVETTHVVWYNTHTCNKDVENIFKTLMLQFLKLKSSSMTFWTSTEADFRITYLKNWTRK